MIAVTVHVVIMAHAMSYKMLHLFVFVKLNGPALNAVSILVTAHLTLASNVWIRLISTLANAHKSLSAKTVKYEGLGCNVSKSLLQL